jgi:hypothetical protein
MTNNDLQSIHIKLKIKQHEPHYKLRCSARVSSSCSTSGTHRVNFVTRRWNILWCVCAKEKDGMIDKDKVRQTYYRNSPPASIHSNVLRANSSWTYSLTCKERRDIRGSHRNGILYSFSLFCRRPFWPNCIPICVEYRQEYNRFHVYLVLTIVRFSPFVSSVD